jgi:CBS domain-containing protein
MCDSRFVHHRDGVLVGSWCLPREKPMPVVDVMPTSLGVLRGTDTIGAAISLLAERQRSGVPVVDESGRLVGMMSSSDILDTLAEYRDIAGREPFLEGTLVQEAMAAVPGMHGPTEGAAKRMLYLEVHRLMVEQDGRLLGLISATDLVRALAVIPA